MCFPFFVHNCKTTGQLLLQFPGFAGSVITLNSFVFKKTSLWQYDSQDRQIDREPVTHLHPLRGVSAKYVFRGSLCSPQYLYYPQAVEVVNV